MIHINQSGYLPEEEKKAVLTVEANCFEVIDCVTGKTVYTGTPVLFGDGCPDACSGDITWFADFSELKTTGSYQLRAGDETSCTFCIGIHVYRQLKIDMLKTYYFQRCGCELLPEHAGLYTHACCHKTPATLWNDPSLQLELSGGWHDAGDYGRYVTAAATALAHLLYAYELFPDSFSDNLNIPESGNGVPDILNECRYELEWLLKMQTSDGGVYHKVSTWHHAPFIMPEQDLAPLFAYAVSSMATGSFAAVTAMAARIYNTVDSDFAARLQSAALLSYQFLKEHPEFIGFQNPEGSGTGEYGDSSDRDERYWAAAELYRLTGKEQYLDDFMHLYQENFNKTSLGYAATAGFGSLSFCLNPVIKSGDIPTSCPFTDASSLTLLRKHLQQAFCTSADYYLTLAENSAYQTAMGEHDFHWGSNMSVMNHGITLLLAYLFTGLDKYRCCALNQLHYLMGCNAMGISYVTGHGERSYSHPHLRTVFADRIDKVIPGFVSGGPNEHPADEPGREQIAPGTPPMKCYLDDYGCYSLNEVTIYWNSPAVFVAAFFDLPEKNQ